MDKHLIAMVGASGSGKSTFAVSLAHASGIGIVCPDTIRGELTGDEGSQDANAQVFVLVRERLVAALNAYGSVIYDATNYNEKNRKIVYEVAEQTGAKIIWYIFRVPFQTLLERQKLRKRQVPFAVIQRQFNLLTIPTKGCIIYADGH